MKDEFITILQVDPGSIRERPGSLDRDTGSNVTHRLRQQREATSLGSWDSMADPALEPAGGSKALPTPHFQTEPPDWV